MPRRLLTIKYDGSVFCGWQVQPNGVSVQSTVQMALNEILPDLKGITGCSRTDAGVHANMYCLHFDTESGIPCEQLVRAVNSKLPNEIAALSCVFVPDDFHARYSSKGKTYKYYIKNSNISDPFNYKYRLNISKRIDEDVLNTAAKAFVGTHDFVGFCSVGSSVTDTVRTVSDCSVTRQGDDVIISITADGFLYNMVRIIVGTLLEVSYGKIDPDNLPSIIASKDRNLAGPTAKPNGLFLDKVHYDINVFCCERGEQ